MVREENLWEEHALTAILKLQLEGLGHLRPPAALQQPLDLQSHGGGSWAQVTEAIKSRWKAGSWVSLADLLCGRETASEGLCIR